MYLLKAPMASWIAAFTAMDARSTPSCSSVYQLSLLFSGVSQQGRSLLVGAEAVKPCACAERHPLPGGRAVQQRQLRGGVDKQLRPERGGGRLSGVAPPCSSSSRPGGGQRSWQVIRGPGTAQPRTRRQGFGSAPQAAAGCAAAQFLTRGSSARGPRLPTLQRQFHLAHCCTIPRVSPSSRGWRTMGVQNFRSEHANRCRLCELLELPRRGSGKRSQRSRFPATALS